MERKSGDELQLGALVSHCEHIGNYSRPASNSSVLAG